MPEASVLATLKEVGIAFGTVLGAGVLLFFVFKKLFEMLNKQQESIEEKEKWWAGYLEENNHTMTASMKEHTTALVNVNTGFEKVNNALEKHNELLIRMLDRLPLK